MWRVLKRTTLVQFGLASIVLGLVLAKYGYSSNLTYCLASLALLPLLSKAKPLALLAVCAIGLNVGLWRGAQIYSGLERYQPFVDVKISVTGRVTTDAAYNEHGQTEFLISDVIEQDTRQSLPGTIEVSAYGITSVERGDTVAVKAKLRDAFGNRQGYMSYATVQVLERDGSWLETVRSGFLAGTYSALPEPHASLGIGFLIGARTLLPAELLLALSITGLTHIVAVSGYNLTIIVRLMRRLFAKRSAFVSVASSFALIAAFVVVTGMSPSVFRAAIVSTLALLAWLYGRSVRPTMLLLFAAALTGFINPLYPWYDLGWHLSFAAFAGVLILAPLIQRRYFKKKPKLLGQLVLETTCAQIAALPIIAVVFGQVSLISLLANVLVLPFIPFAMLATFLAGLGGMLLPVYSGWFAWPARFILTYIIDIVDVLARIPWALKEVDMSLGALWTLYAALLTVVVALWRHRSADLNAAEVIE